MSSRQKLWLICRSSAKRETHRLSLYLASRQLGASLGIDVGSAAATIVDAGEAQHIVEQVVSSISAMKGVAARPEMIGVETNR